MALFLENGFSPKPKLKGESAMKLEVTVAEIAEIFKVIQDNRSSFLRSSILWLPVGGIAVVVVNAVSPSPVREIWPLRVLVKPGSCLQFLLIHIEHELVPRLGDL